MRTANASMSASVTIASPCLATTVLGAPAPIETSFDCAWLRVAAEIPSSRQMSRVRLVDDMLKRSPGFEKQIARNADGSAHQDPRRSFERRGRAVCYGLKLFEVPISHVGEDAEH